jgi:lysyl endopeptidase
MKHVLTLAALFACAVTIAEAAPLLSVPPMASTTPKSAETPSQFLLESPQSPLSIALPSPTAGELSALRGSAATGASARPEQIGFGRAVPAPLRNVPLRTLQWRATADGGRAAQITIAAPESAALRIALRFSSTDPQVSIRLKGNDRAAKVMGPYDLRDMAAVVTQAGIWWSPILEGSSATLEIAVAKGVDIDGMTAHVTGVSHLTRAGVALASHSRTKDSDIGSSGACEINWKCEPPSAALTRAAAAQAKIVFTQSDGGSFECSGSLINDSTSSQSPFFFTADHCIDSQEAAASLNFYWFYDAVDCQNPLTPGDYVLQTDGATLLGRSQAEDWVLLRLRKPPPAGTIFSAWNANPVNSGPMVGLHHPHGDLTKVSHGTLSGYEFIDGVNDKGDVQSSANMADVLWSEGIEEPGSSGSPLLTYLASGDYYEVRGGLGSGSATCEDPTPPSHYSRFDRMLPKMRDYLAPGTNLPNETAVVEYYDSVLDHYFMTASPAEINALDTGAFAGWQRTGLRFLAYTSQVAGTSPVCRFYRAPGFGDSHFYSASPSECSLLVDNPKFPGWLLESASVFYVKLPNPVTGACASGSHALYRFFHASATNHRYTDDIVIRQRLLDAGADWIAEGYGPDAVIMCVPNGA